MTGAALATLVSNCVSALYFVILVLKLRGVVTLRPIKAAFARKTSLAVMSIGLPACLMSMLTTCSNLVVNYLMAAYGDAAIAGIGVAKRVNMASFAITQGITQGALPLIGYNYASGDRRRMRSSVLFMSACTFGFALICLTISLSCTEPLIRAFIDSDETVAYGTRFLRIICWAVLSASVGFIAVTVFQATGKKYRALLLSVLRKGGLDVPLMFILDAHFPRDRDRNGDADRRLHRSAGRDRLPHPVFAHGKTRPSQSRRTDLSRAADRWRRRSKRLTRFDF